MPLGVLKNKIIENQSDPEDLRSTSHIRHGTILGDHFDLKKYRFCFDNCTFGFKTPIGAKCVTATCHGP